MSDLNHLLVSGRLTRDAESRETQNKKLVATLWIAVNGWFGDREETAFLKVACWGRTAEMAATLGKGRRIFAAGRLKFDQWTDREGRKQSQLYLNAEEIKCLPDGASSTAETGGGDPGPERDADAIERQEQAAEATGRG